MDLDTGEFNSVEIDMSVDAFITVLDRELLTGGLTGAGSTGVVSAAIKTVFRFTLRKQARKGGG
jgi:hypothetical protein